METRHGDQIFTLRSADQPYRIFIEQMQEGAVCVLPEGTITYANQRLAEMLGAPLEKVIAAHLSDFVADEQRPALRQLLESAANVRGRREFSLMTSAGVAV